MVEVLRSRIYRCDQGSELRSPCARADNALFSVAVGVASVLTPR